MTYHAKNQYKPQVAIVAPGSIASMKRGLPRT